MQWQSTSSSPSRHAKQRGPRRPIRMAQGRLVGRSGCGTSRMATLVPCSHGVPHTWSARGRRRWRADRASWEQAAGAVGGERRAHRGRARDPRAGLPAGARSRAPGRAPLRAALRPGTERAGCESAATGRLGARGGALAVAWPTARRPMGARFECDGGSARTPRPGDRAHRGRTPRAAAEGQGRGRRDADGVPARVRRGGLCRRASGGPGRRLVARRARPACARRAAQRRGARARRRLLRPGIEPRRQVAGAGARRHDRDVAKRRRRSFTIACLRMWRWSTSAGTSCAACRGQRTCSSCVRSARPASRRSARRARWSPGHPMRWVGCARRRPLDCPRRRHSPSAERPSGRRSRSCCVAIRRAW